MFLRLSNLSVTDCVILSFLPDSSKSKLLFSLFHLRYFMNFMNLKPAQPRQAPGHNTQLYCCSHFASATSRTCHNITPVYKLMCSSGDGRQLEMKAGSAGGIFCRLSGFQNVKAVMSSSWYVCLQLKYHPGCMLGCCHFVAYVENQTFHTSCSFFFFYLFYHLSAEQRLSKTNSISFLKRISRLCCCRGA